jgi:hypothetical protein
MEGLEREGLEGEGVKGIILCLMPNLKKKHVGSQCTCQFIIEIYDINRPVPHLRRFFPKLGFSLYIINFAGRISEVVRLERGPAAPRFAC